MANEVIKRDGSHEAFNKEKIRNSIRSAAQDTGLKEDRIGQVVNEVAQSALDIAAKKDEIATSEITKIILRELDRVEPTVASAWRAHDQSAGKA